MSCDRPCRVVSCRLDFVLEKNFCQDGARQNMFNTFYHILLSLFLLFGECNVEARLLVSDELS